MGSTATIATWGLLVLAGNPGWPAADADLPAPAMALPENQPDDPWFAPAADPAAGCLGQLDLLGFTPDCTPNIAAAEAALGSGLHVDRAWLLTTGDPSVVVAVIDTGVDWSNLDLAARWALNPGELPVPMGAATHDSNRDGAFTVLDFSTATGTQAPTLATIADPRIRDSNRNGILDPQDLIAAFADGRDDDGNGLTDDICGWDFASGDNDAGSAAAHGTRAAEIVLATANNQARGAGICPGCGGLPVRVGTEALATADAVAAGLDYAATREASVALVGLLPIDGGTSLRGALNAALDAAQQRGTLVVASPGNSSGAHQVSPWDPGRALIAGAVGYDAPRADLATSAIAPDPCSAFGAQLAAVAPGHCDDGAAARAAGVAALVASAARGIDSRDIAPLAEPLTSLELRALLTATADPTPTTGATPEPTWSARTGAGRLNARRAVEAVIRRQIPPIARLLDPPWYAMVDPTPGTGFLVAGRVQNPRHAEATWVLEYATGLAPGPASFSPVASGGLSRGESRSVEALVPTHGLFDDPAAPPGRATSAAVTLRLSVSAPTGGTVVTAEARRLVFVHRDLYLLPGFPAELGAPATGGPRVIDLDGDGSDEVLVATTDGRLQVFEATAESMTSWAASTLGPMVASPSAARLMPGGSFVVAAATLTTTVAVYDAQGRLRRGFPVQVATGTVGPNAIISAPVLEDLSSDGNIDVLVTTAAGIIDAFDLDGARLSGFPIRVGEPIGAAAVGDLDGDGRVEIVVASHRLVYAFDRSAGLIAGWPFALDPPPLDLPAALRSVDVEISLPPGPIIGDFDTDDEQPEVAVAPIGRAIVLLRGDGSLIRALAFHDREDFSRLGDARRQGAPIFVGIGETSAGDLDRDGIPDLVHTASTLSFLGGPPPGALDEIEPLVAAWSQARGGLVPGFPTRSGDRIRGAFAIADLDNDGRAEVIYGDRQYRLHATSSAGVSPRGWPKATGGAIIGSPAIGDVDGDGKLDVVAATSNGLLFAWRTDGAAEASVPWPTGRHDHRATGNLATPTVTRTPTDAGSKCGCAAAIGGPTDAKWPTLVLLLVALRRRTR